MAEEDKAQLVRWADGGIVWVGGLICRERRVQPCHFVEVERVRKVIGVAGNLTCEVLIS